MVYCGHVITPRGVRGSRCRREEDLDAALSTTTMTTTSAAAARAARLRRPRATFYRGTVVALLANGRAVTRL